MVLDEKNSLCHYLISMAESGKAIPEYIREKPFEISSKDVVLFEL